LRIDLDNPGVLAAKLRMVRVTNRTTGPGTQTQLDAELGALRLYEDAVIVPDGGVEIARDPFTGKIPASSGTVTFSGLDITVPAFGTKQLFVAGDIPLAARDG